MISGTGLWGIVGAIILGLVLAYANFRNRNINPKNEKIAEAATRESYMHPESYDPQKFRKQEVQNLDGTMPNKNPD